MHHLVTRRCFVVTGNSWAQIFSLVIGTNSDSWAPTWRRLHVQVDRGTELLRGDEDEPTQDPQEVRWARFASEIIHATGIAVRNTRATEVVLVAPPSMLALLRQRAGALLRLDVALAEVSMDLKLLVTGIGRGQTVTSPLPLPMFA